MTLKSFREEISDSVKNGALIILLEICLSNNEQAGTYIEDLAMFFSNEQCIEMQSKVVTYITEMVLLSSIQYRPELNNTQSLALLKILMKSRSWSQEKITKILDLLLKNFEKMDKGACLDLITEICRLYLPSIYEEYLEKLI